VANLDFYATVEDHENLLADLFQAGDLRVFESYSAFDCELREFTQSRHILDALHQTERSRVLLQIWAPAASSKVEIRRFALTVEGHTHRHCIDGWGLMQLYLGKESGTTISLSHFGHFNQRGAEKRSALGPSASSNPGVAADWDWDLIRKISRRIQYGIKSRLSHMKVGSRPVLHQAERLMKDSGYALAPNG
jgi:hypothetical protein